MNESTSDGRPDASVLGTRDPSKSRFPFVVNWGPPILLIAAGTAVAKAFGTHKLAFELPWSAGTFWSGVSCTRNALRCGRFHCTVHGIAHPLLGLAALAITFRLLPLSWNAFWNFAFWPVTVAPFIPEYFGVQYLRGISVGRFARSRTGPSHPV